MSIIPVPQEAEKGINMKEIFEQYGGVLITVAAVLSVILVITAVVGTDSSSIIGQAFSGLIESFIQKANVNAGV